MVDKKRKAWAQLVDHAQAFAPLHQHDPLFKVNSSNITLDYQYQKITQATLNHLFQLAHACDLDQKIKALFDGDVVNISEQRPALHTALRALGKHPIWVNQHNIMHDVLLERERLKTISSQIRAKQWLGYSGKPITDIVHMGIGGSDLGPRFCMKAFADDITPTLGFYFISDADPQAFSLAVKTLNPETTLFIVASKSFTTQETLFNARKAKAWLGDEARMAQHCIAVTTNREKAEAFGIKTILPLWDWVGGRYSLCSSVNLIVAIAIGFDGFNQLLAGARSMDEHFRSAEFNHNVPVLLALLGVWNNNFLNLHQLLMLTYSQNLEQFVPYIQQLDMESNGKSVDNQKREVRFATGPLVWGGPGNQAQHSSYQSLCQGTHKIAADFITLDADDGQMINDMCADKIRVLSNGIADVEHPKDKIQGGVPINHLRLLNASPYTIGALVALYEHKVFVQSVIWDINPFDQPGVECAKRGRWMTIAHERVLDENSL